jgi:hypothetical protein
MLFCFVVGLTLLCAVEQMPPLEPPGQKKGQQQPLITAVETIPASRSETRSVEVVVLQASTHEPLDASGNESLMATSLEGTQAGMRLLALDLWRLTNVSSRFISPQWRQR